LGDSTNPIDPTLPNPGHAFEAQLTTETGEPVVDREVTFATARGDTLCTPVTDEDGWARCGNTERVDAITGGGIHASFAGDTQFLASEDTAPAAQTPLGPVSTGEA
jgi:hypothetical protein